MKKFVKLKVRRDAYGVKEAVENSVSVREFINMLQNKCEDLDAPMAFWIDNGYTLGCINESSIANGMLDENE